MRLPDRRRRQGIRALQLTPRRLALSLLVPLFAGACQAATAPTSLSQCVADRAAKDTPAASLGQVELFCSNLLTDQEQIRRLHATARIYEDQIYQSHVMLYMVVFITLSGVILAGLQLWASYKLASSGKGTLSDGGDFEFKPDDVAVKSSVVGVIILAISLAFFSIYVAQVYKITPLAREAPQPTGVAGPPASVGPAMPIAPAQPPPAAIPPAVSNHT